MTAAAQSIQNRIVRTTGAWTGYRRSIVPGGVLTAIAALAAVVIQLSPAAQAILQFDRHAIAAGQYWRLVTCHLVHWGWGHLAGDISALVLLCVAIGPRRGWRFSLAASGGMAAAIALAVLVFDDGTAVYRGMSGVNYALLAWAIVKRTGAANRHAAAGYTLLLAALGVKVVMDAAVGDLMPAVGLPEGIALVGVAHVAGFSVAILAAAAMHLAGHPPHKVADHR